MFSFRASRKNGGGRHLFGNVVCWLGIAALTGSCSKFETRDVLASVLAVEGEAIVLSRGTNIRATPATLLRTGDHLKTGACSSVTISLVPGARIVVEEDSELEVENLQIHKLAATVSHPVRARNAQVRLLRGSMYASVVFRTVQPHVRLSVTTPVITCEGDPGDAFLVRLNGTTTHILCAAGEVTVISNMSDDTASLEAGYAQDFTKDGRSPPAPFRDANEAVEAQNALKNAEISRELERAKINLFPGIPKF
jgi:ferric-dicitrate binding protein FerR (iron transport regulator)